MTRGWELLILAVVGMAASPGPWVGALSGGAPVARAAEHDQTEALAPSDDADLAGPPRFEEIFEGRAAVDQPEPELADDASELDAATIDDPPRSDEDGAGDENAVSGANGEAVDRPVREPAEPWSPRRVLYAVQFRTLDDANYDSWPDDWTRQRNRFYPLYVPMGIVPDESLPLAKSRIGAGEEYDRRGGGCFRIDMNGGAAAAFSPWFVATRQATYSLTIRIKTSQLEQNAAFAGIDLLAADGRRLQSHYTAAVRGDSDWAAYQVQGVVVDDPQVAYLRVCLRAQPGGPEWVDRSLPPTILPDLHGAALFDDLLLEQSVRMALHTADARRSEASEVSSNRPSSSPAMFFAADRAVVLADLLGLDGEPATVRWQLFDVWRRPVGAAETTPVKQAASTARARWQPPLPDFGFWRVRAEAFDEQHRPLAQSETTLTVARPQAAIRGGQFGWRWPEATPRLRPEAYWPWIEQAGVSWFQYPVWQAAHERGGTAETAALAQRLADHEIEMAAVAAPPPAAIGDARSLADLLSGNPAAWEPELIALVKQLLLPIRFWQLGDDDASYLRVPDWPVKLAAFRERAARQGARVEWGIGVAGSRIEPSLTSGWPGELPRTTGGNSADWGFITYPLSEPPASTIGPRGLRRFVRVQPAPRDRALVERLRDLAWQLADAVQDGADVVVCRDPLDPQSGLLLTGASSRPLTPRKETATSAPIAGPADVGTNPIPLADVTPDELYLPWRTLCHALSGARYLGSIDLPGGSQNRVFARSGEVVVLIWNTRPVREPIALGPGARHLDLWGRELSSTDAAGQPRFLIDAAPSLIVGVDELLARIHLDLSLEKALTPARGVYRHPNALLWQNRTGRPMTGVVRMQLPDRWQADPPEFVAQIPAGETWRQEFVVRLPQDASTGSQVVHLEIELTEPEQRTVRLARRVQVGETDLKLQVTTERTPDGALTIEQTLKNLEPRERRLQCWLYVPGQRRQAAGVTLPPHGEGTFRYQSEAPPELGELELWLRIEELGGPAIISRRFRIE